MTASFQTKWPKSMGPEYAGKPNHFVDKIWTSIYGRYTENIKSNYSVPRLPNQYYECFNRGLIGMYKQKPKKHTFRTDPKDRWKVGMKIHPVINNRTKDRFQFAPVLEVKSIQKVEIIYSDESLIDWYGVEPVIRIDGRVLDYHTGEMEQMALNDGFQSIYQFCHWFNKDFTGKIIHWTDLKY